MQFNKVLITLFVLFPLTFDQAVAERILFFAPPRRLCNAAIFRHSWASQALPLI